MARRSGGAGRVHEGPGDGQHLLLPAGERARAGVAEALEVGEQREDAAEALARVRLVGEPATRRFSSTVSVAKIP